MSLELRSAPCSHRASAPSCSTPRTRATSCRSTSTRRSSGSWTEFDLDLDASRIAFRDGEPVGLGNLGVRGEDAWIGGVGVVTAARRRRRRGAHARPPRGGARARRRRVWLEVIVENAGAFALYEKLGYELVQDVEVWTLPAAEGEHGGPRGSRWRGEGRLPDSARAVAARRRHARPLRRRARARHRQRRDALLRAVERAAPAVRRRARAAAPGAPHVSGTCTSSTCPQTTRRRRCSASSAARSSSASTRCCSTSSTRLDRVRVALVTPFAWSQPHDVNEHVDGLARELRRRGHAVTVLAPSNRARDLAAGRRALLGAFDDPGADRARPGRADLPAKPDGRAGRRPRKPLARARAGPLRRRPRLRAGLAEPLVPRSPRLGGAHRGDLLLARAARLPARPRAARAAAGTRRRAPRDERGGRGCGGRPLPRPLRARAAGDRPAAVRARRRRRSSS